MIRAFASNYRPKIQFRVGKKSLATEEVITLEIKAAVYEKPSYLLMRPKLSPEEIDMLNQGGLPPVVHWKKVAPITDIH